MECSCSCSGLVSSRRTFWKPGGQAHWLGDPGLKGAPDGPQWNFSLDIFRTAVCRQPDEDCHTSAFG